MCNNPNSNIFFTQLDIDGDGEISYHEFTSNMLMKISCAVGENAKK